MIIYRLWDKLENKYLDDCYHDLFRVNTEGVPELFCIMMFEWEDASERIEVEWGFVNNGMKIYERDVIEYKDKGKYVIWCSYGMFTMGTQDIVAGDRNKILRVIGNYRLNPELIEGENDDDEEGK